MSNKNWCPSDVSDEEWAFVAPYLTLMVESAPQREYPLRTVFNGLRYIIRAGCPWRMIPNDLPPWATVYQQTQRWIRAGSFEALVDDLHMLLRKAAGRTGQPTAVIVVERSFGWMVPFYRLARYYPTCYLPFKLGTSNDFT